MLFLFIGMGILPLAMSKTLDSYNSGDFNLNGNIWYVGGSGPGNYSSIQDAIDNASSGDCIFVRNGTYRENIVVYKENLTIKGENKYTTVIDGCGIEEVINIVADYTTITGFTIMNSSRVFIDGIGIQISSDTNIIKENIVLNNIFGIWILNSSNTITKNIISSNAVYGIFVGLQDVIGIQGTPINNSIHRNNITSNGYGIVFYIPSKNNYIYNNNFINNKHRSFFQYSIDNKWDGNYWDDWIGLKCRLFRKIPYFILGLKTDRFILDTPWINLDRHPQLEPYEIN